MARATIDTWGQRARIEYPDGSVMELTASRMGGTKARAKGRFDAVFGAEYPVGYGSELDQIVRAASQHTQASAALDAARAADYLADWPPRELARDRVKLSAAVYRRRLPTWSETQ